jgi:hypothetical protein
MIFFMAFSLVLQPFGLQVVEVVYTHGIANGGRTGQESAKNFSTSKSGVQANLQLRWQTIVASQHSSLQ